MPRLKAPQRREQLIEAATRVYARCGYNAATTRAIAQAAGISEPILYRHFANKQDLVVAIARATSQRTISHWHDLIVNVPTAAEKFRKIACEFPTHVRRLRDAYHVIYGALTTCRDRRVLSVMKDHYAQVEKFLTQIVVEGQKSGEFRHDVKPGIPVWQIISTGAAYSMIGINLKRTDRFHLDETIEFILRGLKA